MKYFKVEIILCAASLEDVKYYVKKYLIGESKTLKVTQLKEGDPEWDSLNEKK